MIHLKNKEQILLMREAGRITGEALLVARELVKEGVSTKQIDTAIRSYIERCGAKPTFLGYGGFPASACISVNDEVIHGIPSADRILQEGDLVKIDTGATFRGFVGDSANTFPVGNVSDTAKRLMRAAKEGFYRGVAEVKDGNRIGDIGAAIEGHVNSFGFTVLRRYVGHGVGRDMHEDPDVPNYGTPGRGARLVPGMTIAIEPMVSAGAPDVYEMPNGWTVRTKDGSLASHYEHTVALTEEGAILLTRVEEDL